ncbi:MAG: 16S rRNA (adenine(1518)-N(6)/adenine(1519)-N(6))-dimethyltransferase RsmA [Pseudomonadota bacterium]
MLSIQTLLKKYGIVPKKSLGQHFLSEAPTIRKIVAAIEPSKEDCIIEIGPGLGIMTHLLAKRAAAVFAIERDRKLIEIARKEHSDIKNIVWIQGDILKLKLDDILEKSPKLSHEHNIKVIGNLPYNISTPILFWILSRRSLISRATIMVQKEVSLRITAKPCCKDYGILSVQVQAYAKAKRLFDVSARNFFPAPEVTSSVVDIDFTKADVEKPKDEALFKTLVRAAFGKRRKTLRNSLIGAVNFDLSASDVDCLLRHANINGTRRAETLTVSEFIKLASLMEE